MQTILIVDDQKMVRDVTKSMVEWCGFATMEAASGVEALQIFERYQERIAVVLLDMVMSELSGEATFFSLRQIRNDLPIVFMSGVEKDDLSDFLLQHAEVGFIHKPYRIQDLWASLKHVLTPNVESAGYEEVTRND